MYTTIDEIKKAHTAAGGHFFDHSARSGFHSRIHDKVYGGRYFVTSESMCHGCDRRFTIRKLTECNDIVNAGEFGEYRASQQAHTAAAKLAMSDNGVKWDTLKEIG